MSNTTLLVLVVAVAVVAVVFVLLVQIRRSRALRSRFGPEYARTVDELGDRRRAEAELHAREKRVRRLELRDLPSPHIDGFVRDWRAVQSRFVDEPGEAIREADVLLTDLMIARGYPMTDFDRRAADLSVDHGELVENYRRAHAVAERQADGGAGTEDLRQAMIHYRDLFDDLIGRPTEAPAPHRRAS